MRATEFTTERSKITESMSDNEIEAILEKHLTQMLKQGIGQRSAFTTTVNLVFSKLGGNYQHVVDIAKRVFANIVGSHVTESDES